MRWLSVWLNPTYLRGGITMKLRVVLNINKMITALERADIKEREIVGNITTYINMDIDSGGFTLNSGVSDFYYAADAEVELIQSNE